MSPVKTAPAALTVDDEQLRAQYLDEVLAVLYPGVDGHSVYDATEYLVVPHARRPRLLVPAAHPRLAAAAVRRYAEPHRGFDRRFSKGLTFQWNYVLSKLITDSENYSTGGAASDQYNRILDKGLSSADQTHVLKLSTVYELPVFKGRRFLGGWRVSAIQVYANGTPVAVTRNNSLPLFNGGTRPFITSGVLRPSTGTLQSTFSPCGAHVVTTAFSGASPF